MVSFSLDLLRDAFVRGMAQIMLQIVSRISELG